MIISLFNKVNTLLLPARNIPEGLSLLLARIAVAMVFWRSAQTKISGGDLLGQSWQFYNLNSSTTMLFEYEYGIPLIPAEIAAYMATFGEFFLSLFLIFGLFTRFSALGLLVMTSVIQFLVFPEAWPTHILWAALLVYLLKEGAGKLSLDYLIGRKS